MKKLLYALAPKALRVYRESRLLNRLPAMPCDTSNLRSESDVSLSEIFGRTVDDAEWGEVRDALDAFEIPDGTGGVNPGDRRAVYYLLRYFGATSVLEVGTHIGASTVHVASAVARNEATAGRERHLHCVDIADVNDPVTRPWERAGSKFSPREMIEQLGHGDFVEFETGTSLDHLDTDATYDFIFLDGDHSPRTVYSEVPAALRSLNPGGVILLHDYYPDLKQLYPESNVLYGPYLGIERIKSEGADVAVVPLGDLPWPTKQGTHTTSLALLLKRG